MCSKLEMTEQMSSKLKERLKKCGRTYTSPGMPSMQSPSQSGTCSSHGPSCLDKQVLTPLRKTPVSRGVKRRRLSHEAKSDTKLVCEATDFGPAQVELFHETDLEADKATGDALAHVIIQANTPSSEVSDLPSNSPCGFQDHKDEDNTATNPSLLMPDSGHDLVKVKKGLQEDIERKEDLLRKLNMVKMYHEKHNAAELARLTKKWLDVSQEALQRLWEHAAEPKPSLTEIINHCQLQHDFIQYDPEEESFY